MNGGEWVFVYGTLRRGGSSDHRMEGSEYVGPASVTGRLYRVSWYPALVLDKHAGAVLGDLWRVPSAALADLDDYEGSEYQRVKTRVGTVDAGQAGDVWAWVWKEPESLEEASLIECGDWLKVQD